MRRTSIQTSGVVVAVLSGLAAHAGAPSNGAGPPAATTAVGQHAVEIARTTTIPACTVFVDAAGVKGDGSVQKPHKTIAAAVERATPGAVICVAEGIYAETLTPGEKDFTLAGGFQRGSGFKVRDSAKYVSEARGKGGSFLQIKDPGPANGKLTAIDGFEITGYSQAIVRDYYESQRFDITNNHIHDNVCADPSLVGAGFALNNVSGAIRGNVFAKNSCGRGGAGFLNDTTNQNTVAIENNLIDSNSGTEPTSSHGGALYLFGNTLKITGNLFTNNTVTQWGGGLYVGAFTPGNQPTTATMLRNVYRANRAANSGGGFFCDDGAMCIASYEVYDRNCGGNIMVDGGAGGSGPTITKFDHITNTGALTPDCSGPGIGFWLNTYDAVAPDNHTISNSLFWENAVGQDLATSCDKNCGQLKLNVSKSMVQVKAQQTGVTVTFGKDIMLPADPQFVDRAKGDFRLRPESPAIGKGAGGSDLGAFGSGEAGPPANVVAAASAQPAEAESKAAAAPAVVSPVTAQSANDVTAKQAFDDAKALGTVDAWTAFLDSYPTGFHANLARAYLKSLAGAAAAPTPPPALETAGEIPAVTTTPAKPIGVAPLTYAGKPAVARGDPYMGFPERFNRYYIDPNWKPSKAIYVSPSGTGDGATPASPAPFKDAVSAATPGTLLYFLRGAYSGGIEFTKETSGTYDEPIVLYGERNTDGSIGVTVECARGSRQTCINFEAADYIAIDGFELIGGKYGVRAVGTGFTASEHSRGIAVLNCKGHDQDKDPFFTAQSDWTVLERNVAYGAGKGDGHGIYLSNGGDWNIVRFNETYGNVSSDFQINADPASTCQELGIPFEDPRCDGYAGIGEGGQGASDYFLVDGNYFHHGIGPGANFTSVRRSLIRNNIFGLHGTKHNVSFWQETDNPRLGSSDNKILNNLFITTGRHGVQFKDHSTRNEFVNNVILGVQLEGRKVLANPSALLMEVDDTVGENVYRSNFYAAGKLEGRAPNGEETALAEFSQGWFAAFPASLNHDANDFTPTAAAPFLGLGLISPNAPVDRNGIARSGRADLGPIELP